MNLNLFKKKDRLLGIDISASAVKLVELSGSRQRLQVEAIAMEPLPEGAMEDRNPTDPYALGTALKRAVKASGSRLKTAAIAVPTSNIITRTIPMPVNFGEDEIEAHILVEAAHYIPFPLEEIYLDFQVQGPSKTSADMQDVMIVASRKENVDLREEALTEAGLKAVIVDVEVYALENTFQQLLTVLPKTLVKDNGDTCTAMVDLGGAVTTLYVFQGRKIIFTREQPFGGDQLTQAIADAYELPKERAELAKRSGELPEDYPTTLLTPFKQSAAEQIGHSLQFFFSSSHYNSVDQIILVGGGSLAPGLDKTVADLLAVPTKIGNPFEHIGNATRVNRRNLLRDAPLFAVACGLALRSFG